jgi:hypothetical protein
MCNALLFLALSAVAFCPSAKAVDYAKVDRTLSKEPAYKNAPKYALLLFGKEAKLRVWVVLDGETLYLDRRADGDLTAKEARFARLGDCRDVEICDPDGKTTYLIKYIGLYQDKDYPEGLLQVGVVMKGPLAYQQYGGGELKGSPRAALIAHFHGRLTIGPRTFAGKVPAELALVTGPKPTELEVHVGTMDAKHGCWVAVRSHDGEKSAFPKGVFPIADAEFPSRAPGGAPVKKRYQLDKFC